jgi:hypothetical protein
MQLVLQYVDAGARVGISMFVVVRKGASHAPALVGLHAQGAQQAVHGDRPRVVGVVQTHFALAFFHLSCLVLELTIPYTNQIRVGYQTNLIPTGSEENQMSVHAVVSSRTSRNRKFSDEALLELHCQGLSVPKLAKQLGVSQQPVRSRMKKLGLKANCKGGGVPRYEEVGTARFRCAACKKVKPLRQRNGTICTKCHHDRWVSTRVGALRFRFSMKKCHARRKGIAFALTFEDFNGLYERQEGRDGYTGQQMSFDFGQGRSGATVSLDRIDNEKGYTPDNVVFCRVDTNARKNAKPKDEFMKQLAFEFPEANDPSLEPPGRPSI